MNLFNQIVDFLTVEVVAALDRLTDPIAALAPWAAPIPTAFLVGSATVEHLGWPRPIGIVAAVIVESLGLATTATALELYQYNQIRRKLDPSAPFWLAAGLVGVYFIVATVLTVLLDVWDMASAYAPVLFPVLSLAGVTTLALRGDHKRRLSAIKEAKEERKRTNRQPNMGAQLGAQETAQDALAAGRAQAQLNAQARKVGRINQLLELYASNPMMAPADAARELGVHRNTIHNDLKELETAGRVRKNGHGVEILQ